MADNPEGGKASYTTASMNIMGVKSFALEKMGRHEEAAQAYAEYLKNPLSGSTIGKVNAVSYLNAAKRYAEAEQNINNIEDVLRQMGMKMDMVNIVGLVRGKFVAHLGAGHRDSALAVATRIIEGLDSAEVWAKRDKATELATVYETHEKDVEIAQQKASIIQTRLLAMLVAVVMIAAIIIVYSLMRLRSAARLKVLNEQLKEANIQLQQNNYQLTIAKARAEESSHMKTDFIQQISHEIRTPLNILSGFTQVLTTNGMDLDDETRQDINRQVVENTDRITELVNKMLELSDINSRTVLEMTDQISVMQIAAEAIDASAIGEAEHLTFDFKPGDGAETTVITTNHQAAVRALTLLLDNARKFTAPAEALGNNEPADNKQRALLSVNVVDGKVQFVVEDTGIGVPAAEAEHIFDEFVQLNEYYDGTGIGLTVARSLARRLGGDIVLDTTYTQGARFVMTLA
jgi:signal transduction histidine kinase